MLLNVPNKVTVVEVGPRDGFQIVKTFIPTESKIELIRALIAAGLRDFELTSFVSPKAIPQLADAADVCRAILSEYGDTINASALIPNLKGAQSAWDAGIREAACVMSVSESHNKANINRTHEESFAELGNILFALPDMKVRVDLATAFACPFEGWTPVDAVVKMAKTIYQMGIRKMVLADTIGVAGPDRVLTLCQLMRKEFPDVHFSLHLHDTRGTGLANTIAGLQAGIDSFETSIAGLGGCPFAPGAAGNTATEDMVSMFADMGIDTGVDLNKLLAAVAQIQLKVDAPVNSHLSKAKLYDSLK